MTEKLEPPTETQLIHREYQRRTLEQRKRTGRPATTREQVALALGAIAAIRPRSMANGPARR